MVVPNNFFPAFKFQSLVMEKYFPSWFCGLTFANPSEIDLVEGLVHFPKLYLYPFPVLDGKIQNCLGLAFIKIAVGMN